MINNQTVFNVCDNSGVTVVKCFKLSKNSIKSLGSLIYVIAKKMKNQEILKIGLVTKAIIVRTKFSFHRLNGHYFFFNSNDVILINKKYELLGTRIFGPLVLELRKKQMIKILSISTKII